MKRKYLIKKNPSIDAKNNWLVMTFRQYQKWTESPEGKSREFTFGVLKHICEQYGYSYILLKKTKDSKKMANQIIDILRRKHVHVVTNVEEDIKAVQQKYLDLVRLAIQERKTE